MIEENIITTCNNRFQNLLLAYHPFNENLSNFFFFAVNGCLRKQTCISSPPQPLCNLTLLHLAIPQWNQLSSLQELTQEGVKVGEDLQEKTIQPCFVACFTLLKHNSSYLFSFWTSTTPHSFSYKFRETWSVSLAYEMYVKGMVWVTNYGIVLTCLCRAIGC